MQGMESSMGLEVKISMNYYVGIDIGKYHHQAILCDENAKAVAPPLRFSVTSQGFRQLSDYVKKYGTNATTMHAGMEATGAYWVSIHQYLQQQNMRTTVLNPLQVSAYRNENIRGSKTDRIDAMLIVKVLRFGDYKSSDFPDEDIIALRQLTRLRSGLVVMTTSLKKRVIAMFDQTFPEYKQLFDDMFGTSSQALLREGVLPEQIAAINTEKLTMLLKKASHGRLGSKQALRIKQAASETIGIRIALDAFSLSIEVLLTQIAHVEKQVERLNDAIEERFTKQNATLTTIPGVGNTTAAVIIAEIGNFDRFANDKNGAEKLVALAGIDPKIRESGMYKGQAKMSKRGSSYLRNAVRQAAFVASCTKRDPMFLNIYQKQMSLGKPFEVALSHVANKMLHVIYSLLKHKTAYKPCV